MFEGDKVPVPFVVQIPVVVAPLIVPFSVAVDSDEQRVWSGPVLTTGAGVILIWRLSVATLQLFAVRNTVAPPLAISNELGMYVAFSDALLGRKIPVPLVPHVPEAAPPPTLPFSGEEELFAHTVTSFPALDVPAGRIVIVIWSFTAVHEPLPVEVNVSTTLPAATSATLDW